MFKRIGKNKRISKRIEKLRKLGFSNKKINRFLELVGLNFDKEILHKI